MQSRTPSRPQSTSYTAASAYGAPLDDDDDDDVDNNAPGGMYGLPPSEGGDADDVPARYATTQLGIYDTATYVVDSESSSESDDSTQAQGTVPAVPLDELVKTFRVCFRSLLLTFDCRRGARAAMSVCLLSSRAVTWPLCRAS